MTIPITYSHLESYESCPHRWHTVKVLKRFKESGNVYSDWGTRVHTALESFVQDGVPLPTGMEQWRPLMAKIAAIPGTKYVEREMALDKSFQPAEWDGSWTRGKGDLCVVHKRTGAVLDYKTGKFKPSEQLHLYAAMLFAHHPEVEVIHTKYVWLASKKLTGVTIHRDQLSDVWKSLLPRYRRIEIAFEKDNWPKKPSGLCNGYCPVSDCTHYRDKR